MVIPCHKKQIVIPLLHSENRRRIEAKSKESQVLSMNYLKESRFEGSVLGFIGYYLIMTLLTIFTLGIAYPWGYVMFQRWLCRNTVIDGHRLYFDGTGTQLFGNYIKWWFFTLITVGIYGLWLYNKMTNWRVKHTHMVSAGDSLDA